MPHTPVRVRIAPSPTGYFHVGSARTALFNWLFARHHGGQFIVRIEDTDQARYHPQAVADAISSLRWLDLDWDEGPDIGGDYGPYCQSERLNIYREHANWLVERGHAYRCYCSPERLARLREEQRQAKEDVGYDRHCRYLTEAQRAAYEAEGRVPVVRLKVPEVGRTSFHDELYGTISVDNHTQDDLILLKSDGYPTYHLANVVDDHLMAISHIMRGDEWLSSVPKHVLLYAAFGWPMPIYAHLPLILAPTGKGKLSKRHGGVEVREFRRQGYLPEAMVNYLARVGWSYDDKTEVFAREELIQAFDLAGINSSPARFSYERLEWMNAYYIRQLDVNDLAARLQPFLAQAGFDVALADIQLVVPLVQERLKTLADVVEWTDFFFQVDLHYEPALLVGPKMTAAASLAALRQVQTLLEPLPDLAIETVEPLVRNLATHLELKASQLFGIVRIAVTGKSVAPPLFETMSILGKHKVLARLQQAIVALESRAS